VSWRLKRIAEEHIVQLGTEKTPDSQFKAHNSALPKGSSQLRNHRSFPEPSLTSLRALLAGPKSRISLRECVTYGAVSDEIRRGGAMNHRQADMGIAIRTSDDDL